jgi:RHS repeat-associated protein
VGRTVDADGAGAGVATAERYVFDGQHVAMVFASGGSEPSERFMYGPGTDMVLAEQRGATLLWTLGDHQGSIRDVTAADGALRNHLRYTTFGAIASQTDGSFGPRFSYTGREFDPATGLYGYRARWYDARLGRFISADPAGFAAGDANLYRYVGNSPTFMVDPSGNQGVLARIGNVFSGGHDLSAEGLQDYIDLCGTPEAMWFNVPVNFVLE